MGLTHMMMGSPVLMGDNPIPGVLFPQRLKDDYPKILNAVTKFGCDPYPTIVELLTYDEISEVASYGGFPVRYPHWQFGMEYEEMSRGYEFGQYKIYEMVINTNPCYLYCLDSNPHVDHVTVIAHALGHCDFFKHNIWFDPTTRNALNEFANHGTRIRNYMERWGAEKVLQFIDWILCIDDLIDPGQAWVKPKLKGVTVKDSRVYQQPRQLQLSETGGVRHDYMKTWINPKSWIDKEKERIRHNEIMAEMDMFGSPQRNILGYLVENAPLNLWQADIASMLYREAQYFYPQRVTKMLNEGWASYVDFNIMSRQHMAGNDGIVHYGKHKAGVLGGKYSMNPYAVGFKLFLHIEERWNKGRFGREYEDCQDADLRREWDTKAGLGHDKVFEVRKHYNDVTAVHEFVDQDFCDKFELYKYGTRKNRDGDTEYVIESRDAKVVKKHLIDRYKNGGRPDILLEDPNYGNKNLFLMQHKWDGRTLQKAYAQETLKSIWNVWTRGGNYKHTVAIATKDKDEREIVYVCAGPGDKENVSMTRKEFESQYA